jgi:hypothetical protein
VLLAGAAAGGLELIARGVLPGQQVLDRLDGACTVAGAPLTFRPAGPAWSGTFYSRARQRPVGYTIAYPPGHRPGSRLPLVVVLHAFGGDHRRALAGISLAQALALTVNGRGLPPMALAAADGAVAAISPAIWTSYQQARAVNPGAYASAAAFARADVVSHAGALAGVAVHTGTVALARALPPGAVVDISAGCHTGPFFTAAEPPSLAFLARHLAG